MSFISIVSLLGNLLLFSGGLFNLMYLWEEEKEEMEVNGDGRIEPEKNEEK